jgi:hypothetical protein
LMIVFEETLQYLLAWDTVRISIIFSFYRIYCFYQYYRIYTLSRKIFTLIHFYSNLTILLLKLFRFFRKNQR